MNEALNNEQRVGVSVPGPEVAKEIETIDRLEEAQKDDRFITKQMAIGGGLSVVIFSFPLALQGDNGAVEMDVDEALITHDVSIRFAQA